MAYFTACFYSEPVQTIQVRTVFGVKFVCVLVLHFIVTRDLKIYTDFLRWLKQLSSQENVSDKPRLLQVFVLSLSGIAGVVCETMLILVLSRIPEFLPQTNI